MSTLVIRERRVNDVTILDMAGKIRIGDESISLRAAIRQLLKEGQHRILLNLANILYVDSSGLGEIISSYTALRKNGGQLKLLYLTEPISELMTFTKLLTVFDVYDNESEAVESFSDVALEIETVRPSVVRNIHGDSDGGKSELKAGAASIKNI
jgi:anti-sigma B factor antagonist